MDRSKKFCPDCGAAVTASATPNREAPAPAPRPRPSNSGKMSKWWWVMPFFLGLLGGTVVFLTLRKENYPFARRVLIYSTIWSVVLLFLLRV